MIIVEAFICHVAGQGGTRHGRSDAPPSLPQGSAIVVITAAAVIVITRIAIFRHKGRFA